MIVELVQSHHQVRLAIEKIFDVQFCLQPEGENQGRTGNYSHNRKHKEATPSKPHHNPLRTEKTAGLTVVGGGTCSQCRISDGLAGFLAPIETHEDQRHEYTHDYEGGDYGYTGCNTEPDYGLYPGNCVGEEGHAIGEHGQHQRAHHSGESHSESRTWA